MPERLILVVEDEVGIADNVVYALNTEGFATLRADTGSEALRLFRERKPDLLILDIGLPDTTGFDLCREIRSESEVPIIFLTARDAEIDRVVGLEIGADDYVVKPFSPRELTARVRARLRRSTQAGKDENPADLRMDESSHQAFFNDKDLGLTRYEFRLLKTLLSQPGRVFSREQLLEQAWDHPEEALDRTVDTHIKTLRQKVKGLNAGKDPIQTHRGLGYSCEQF